MYAATGIVSIIIGLLAILAIASDIQVILVAVCLLGGIILIGVQHIIKKLNVILSNSKPLVKDENNK